MMRGAFIRLACCPSWRGSSASLFFINADFVVACPADVNALQVSEAAQGDEACEGSASGGEKTHRRNQ
eukprot:7175453-Pyramimonas_sp.AAC.1